MGAESAVALMRQCECGMCRVGNAFEHLRDMHMRYRGAVMEAESAVAAGTRCECGKCRVGNAYKHSRDTPIK